MNLTASEAFTMGGMADSERARSLERLSRERFDLLVVGAGIIGARVALEAALAGDRVALVDAGDFGGATSSASSKLVHGGLRYLRLYDFKLVRESHLERAALLTRVAPHLVRPLLFVLPFYRGGPHPPAPLMGAGLGLYSALGSFRHSHSRLIRARRAREYVPSLKTGGMGWSGLYEDAQTDDARLVLATVKAAAAAGAVVLNHARVSAIERGAALVHAAGAADLEVRFRAAVNAAGPWVDELRRLEDPSAAPLARLSKGVHVTVPLPEGWRAALATPLPRLRVAFAVPWQGVLLLGTTDTEYRSDPAAVGVDESDVQAVLGEAQVALPAEVAARDKVLYSFAGLRVLPGAEGDTAAARREHVVATGRTGMVSVAGGKLTTHRLIALDVLRRLDPGRYRLHDDPLPGAGPLPSRPSGVEAEAWAHLVSVYGSEAATVATAGPLERIHPDGPDLWAQVDHARDREWALTVEDVVRRRTSLSVRGLDGEAVRIEVGRRLQPKGGAVC